jgi:hypothetical protein
MEIVYLGFIDGNYSVVEDNQTLFLGNWDECKTFINNLKKEQDIKK